MIDSPVSTLADEAFSERKSLRQVALKEVLARNLPMRFSFKISFSMASN